jgi:ribose transport system substrate-binding protein
MLNKILVLFYAFSFVVILGGCGDSKPYSTTTKKIKVAFITNTSADFWAYAQAGCKKAELEFSDLQVIFKSGDGTTSKQKQIAEDLLVSGVKGIAISPVSPRNQISMINNWVKDSKVLCVDSDSPESNRLAYLGTNNIEAGRQCGELLKEALPNGGKVMVFVGLKDVQNAQERFQGLKEAIKGSKIEIIDLRTDGGDAAKARANAKDSLTAHPDLAGMVGLWGYNAPACLEAVKSSGLLGKVKIVAFDEAAKTLEGIDQGFVHGTVVQSPYQFGYDSMTLLRNQILNPSEIKNKIIYIPTQVLKKGQGLEYKKQCDQWKAEL